MNALQRIVLLAVAWGTQASVWAAPQSLAECDPPPVFDVLPIKKLHDTLKRFELSSVCPPEEQMFLTQAREEDAALKVAGDREIQGSVRGFDIMGTRAELEIVDRLLGKNPPKNWMSRVQGCADVRCFLGKLYASEEAALRALVVAKKYGYALGVSQESFDPGAERIWTSSEIRSAQRAVASLPSNFHRLPHLKAIVRGDPKAMNQGTSAGLHWCDEDDGRIAILDGAFVSAIEGTRTLAHELGHALECDYFLKNGGRMTFGEAAGFNALSGWRKVYGGAPDQFVHAPASQFVSNYAKTRPTEDFAETVSRYVFGPGHAKMVAPDKFNWMKLRVFSGRDYLSPPSKPDVVAAMDRQGTSDTLASRCMDRIGLRYQEVGSEILVVIDATSKFPASAIWASDFMGYPKCLDTEMADALKEITSDIKGCRPGLQEELIEAFSARIRAKVDPVISQSRKFVIHAKKTGFPGCTNQRDFTLDCRLREAGVEPSSIPARVKEEWKDLAVPLDTIKKQVNFDAAFLACVENAGEWFMNSEKKPFYFFDEKKSGGYPDLNQRPFCASAVTSLIRKSGIRIEVATAEKVLSEPEFSRLSIQFEKLLMPQMPAIKKTCGDKDDCISRGAAVLIDAWEQNLGRKLSVQERAQWLKAMIHVIKMGPNYISS